MDYLLKSSVNSSVNFIPTSQMAHSWEIKVLTCKKDKMFETYKIDFGPHDFKYH